MDDPRPASRSRRTTCLINPRAANSRWVRKREFRDYLQARLPGEIRDLFGDARTTVDLARKAGANSDLVVAIGGDGTIADVLQGLFESGRAPEIVLGVIPFGSGNAFRKSFGIPKNPERALDILARGVPRTIDVVEVEGRYAGFVSVGATAGVTQEQLRFKARGLRAHLMALGKLFAFPLDEKRLELHDGIEDNGAPFDRKVVSSRFFDCVIAKTNHFGYGWRVAPRARVDDGYLDITLFETGPVRYLLMFPLIYFGIYQRRQRHFKARRLVIEGRDLPVQYNGEMLGRRDRLEFKVMPGAVQIICPDTRRVRRKFLKASS